MMLQAGFTASDKQDLDDLRNTNKLVSNIISQSRHSRVIAKARAYVNQNPSRPFTPVQSKRRLSERAEQDFCFSMARKLATLPKKTYQRSNLQIESKEESATDSERKNSNNKQTSLDTFGLKGLLSKIAGCTDFEKLNDKFWDELWSSVDNSCAHAEEKKTKNVTDDIRLQILESTWAAVAKLSEKNDFLEENETSVVKAGRTCLKLSRICLRCSLNAFEEQDESLNLYLHNSCKILFKMAKNQQFDHAFREEHVLDTLLFIIDKERSDQNSKVLLYVLGCLKFLSNEEKNQRALAQLGTVSRLVELMKTMVHERPTKAGEERLLSQLLVLVLATIRNLALDKRHMRQYWTHNVVGETCACMATYHGYPELMLNCVRVLSKLSMYSEGRAAIVSNKGIPRLVALLRDYHDFEIALSIRALFILGNLTAGNAASRLAIFEQPKALPMLMSMLEKYTDEYLDENSHDKQIKEETNSIITKLVRLLANLAIDEEIGPQIASHYNAKLLVLLLGDTIKKESRGELCLNILATISNLSFYYQETYHIEEKNKDEVKSGAMYNVLFELHSDILPLLVPFLFETKEEFTCEAVRTMANFSRDIRTHELISRLQIDQAIVILLDHVNRDLVYDSCGVLTNIVSCESTYKKLSKQRVPNKLISILRRSSLSCPELSTICCMALHNYVTHSSSQTLDDEEIELLEGSLLELIEIVSELEKGDIWNEFIHIANSLVKILS